MDERADVYLTNARLVDGTGAPPREAAAVLLEASPGCTARRRPVAGTALEAAAWA